MPFAPVRDIQMYYEIQGKGPRLLVIPGTGSDLRQPGSFFQSPVAKEFEILQFDPRGMGQTDKPDQPYSMEDYAEDTHALLEYLGWDTVHVLGISFGGMIAQEYALRYPEEIERLVLACTSSGGDGGPSFPIHNLPDEPLEDHVRRLLRIFDTRITDEWIQHNSRFWERKVERMVSRLSVGAEDPGHEVGKQRQLEARRDHNTYHRLPQLFMPVYVCGGTYDGAVPAENIHAIHQQIPQAQLDFFEGGHLFLMEDLSAHQAIRDFLLAS
ncbi:MAG: alpha/beta hydrolase [Deltaproteobacteria bacterium]|nr:MAG: alpha/beta hydrolase [Deltaproteobacteria bacterium]